METFPHPTQQSLTGCPTRRLGVFTRSPSEVPRQEHHDHRRFLNAGGYLGKLHPAISIDALNCQ